MRDLTLTTKSIIDRDDLAKRWQCDRRTAVIWAARLKIQKIKLGHRTIRYRLEDVLKAEERCKE